MVVQKDAVYLFQLVLPRRFSTVGEMNGAAFALYPHLAPQI
jgi:hypothetical protein